MTISHNEISDTQLLWQQARSIFAEYLHKPIDQSLSELEARDDLSKPVKEKVSRLVLALNKSATILQDTNSAEIFRKILKLSDMTGQYVDHYKLEELIAVGGMSSIYKARRVESEVQKPVAIKVIAVDQHDKEVISLFSRELKVLSKLNHQNIVAFLHGGQSAEGYYYLAMELLENAITLSQYTEKNKSDCHSIVYLIKMAAHAMVNAHDHLVIHGDLKAENILMDANHQLKIVDFGIAAFTYQQMEEKCIAYTPAIASPEQVMGKNITVKSDIFSLAATLLQLLTGETPQPVFNSGNYQPEAIDTYVQNLLFETNIDRELGSIIRKAMHSDVEQRYMTMYGFSEDLDRWLTSNPVLAYKGNKLYHIKKFAIRNKLLAGGLLLITFLLLVGLVVVQNYALNARKEAEKAQKTLDFMTDVLSQADPAHADRGNTTIREAFNISLNQSDDLLKNNSDSQISILTKVTEIFNELALYAEAAETAEKLHKVYVLTEGEYSKNALHWQYETASYYHSSGAFEKCFEIAHDLIQKLDNEGLEYYTVKLNGLNVIIKCHVERFENQQAYHYMSVAQRLIESGKIKDKEAIGRISNSFAVIARRGNQFELSEKFYRQSLSNMAQSVGKANVSYATIMNGFGRMYMKQGLYDMAKPYLSESMGIVRSFDPDSHVLARNMSYYAQYLFETGEPNKALDLLDEAIVIAEKRQHKFTLLLIQHLRYRYNAAVGDIDAAIDASLNVILVAYHMYGRDHPHVSQYLTELAMLLEIIDHPMADQVWQVITDFYHSNRDDTFQKELVMVYVYQGLSAWNKGQWQQANEFMEKIRYLEVDFKPIETEVLSELLIDPHAQNIHLLSKIQRLFMKSDIKSESHEYCVLTPNISNSDQLLMRQIYAKVCLANGYENQTVLLPNYLDNHGIAHIRSKQQSISRKITNTLKTLGLSEANHK